MSIKDRKLIDQIRKHLDKMIQIHGKLSPETQKLEYLETDWFCNIAAFADALARVERECSQI